MSNFQQDSLGFEVFLLWPHKALTSLYPYCTLQNMLYFVSASKDVADKEPSSQYFIHGYDVPRMFGYSNENSMVNSNLI